MTTTRPPWRPLSAGVATAGIVGVLCPLPSSAAPVPCAHPQRHAAEAGAELLRLHRFDLRPTGRPDPTVTDISIGEARSAMVAQSAVSAAAARTLAHRKPARPGTAAGTGTAPAAGTGNAAGTAAGTTPAELTRAVRQQAPPEHPTAAQADTPGRQVGPLDLGEGSLTSRARWDAALGCGNADGEITRARAVLTHVGLLTDRSGRALLRLPSRVEARSTTALQRRGTAVHSVARAGVTSGTVEVLGGAVRLTIVKPPTLSTSISAAGAAEVRYVPAMLEVSGAGFGTIVLTTPGDQAELRLDEPQVRAADDPDATRATGPDAGGTDTPTESTAVPAVPGDPLRRFLTGLPAGDLPAAEPPAAEPPAAEPPAGDLPSDGSTPAERLALPEVPDLPPLPGDRADRGQEESGDTRSILRVSIGEVRQAVVGHAVAARVAALRLEITTGVPANPPAGAYAAGRPVRGGTVLDLDVGMLEAAAVAPEPATTGDAAGGTGAGLPVTGARIDLTVVAGAALLIVGLVCLVVGLRRRAFRP